MFNDVVDADSRLSTGKSYIKLNDHNVATSTHQGNICYTVGN